MKRTGVLVPTLPANNDAVGVEAQEGGWCPLSPMLEAMEGPAEARGGASTNKTEDTLGMGACCAAVRRLMPSVDALLLAAE